MEKSHFSWKPSARQPPDHPFKKFSPLKAASHWRNIGLRPHHGICLPLFSLRSQKSCGIGEFNDLLPLIDWCASLGLDTIQLLPLFDSGDDPSPYNILSSCALDPIYLSLQDLPDIDEDLTSFLSLTRSPRIEREQVKKRKLKCLSRYFQKHFAQIQNTLLYQQFLAAHSWVQTYALFKVYQEENKGRSWLDWPVTAREPTAAAIDEKKNKTDFHSFLQYLCFQQISAVHRYASSRGVFLLTDNPILIRPDSADVWEKPALFDLRIEVGAVPDFYNAQGQCWGFPLYNWDAMRVDHFQWWQRRLTALLPYSDLYRIDHTVGFFRLWGIAKGKKAAEGNFYPSEPTLWLKQGRELLAMMLDNSPLLPIAEDLGAIPTGVRACLQDLGICSTKVMRWEYRSEKEDGLIPFNQYEPLSLTTVSTHDSEPLALWWEKYPHESALFAQFKRWSYESVLSIEHRKELLRDSHHTSSLFHINLLQETLALFPELIWPHLEDERINVPGTLLPTNWTYRFKPYVEEIVSDAKLERAFQEILKP